MFMKSKDDKHCGLYCTCGCESGVVLSAEKDEDFGYCISLVSDNWYISQLTGWFRFKEKCKRIWKILRNKEHYYFLICLDNEDIQEFKEFVAKIQRLNTHFMEELQ